MFAEDMYENGNKIGAMGCPQKLRRINNEISGLKIDDKRTHEMNATKLK